MITPPPPSPCWIITQEGNAEAGTHPVRLSDDLSPDTEEINQIEKAGFTCCGYFMIKQNIQGATSSKLY